MSYLQKALERLDSAVHTLDHVVSGVESQHAEHNTDQNNVVDVDFVSRRLDKAIDQIESILEEDDKEHI